MVERNHQRLSIRQQCRLLGIKPGYVVLRARRGISPQPAANAAHRRAVLKDPSYGARQMTKHLRRQGYGVNRKKIQRLMQKMGLVAIYQKPQSQQAPS